MSEHTLWESNPSLAPPWKVNPPDSRYGIWHVSTDRGDPSEEYDLWEDPPEWAARLCVAVPDLYEVAKELIEAQRHFAQYASTLEGEPEFYSPKLMAIVRHAREAITKATGETS